MRPTTFGCTRCAFLLLGVDWSRGGGPRVRADKLICASRTVLHRTGENDLFFSPYYDWHDTAVTSTSTLPRRHRIEWYSRRSRHRISGRDHSRCEIKKFNFDHVRWKAICIAVHNFFGTFNLRPIPRPAHVYLTSINTYLSA